MVFDQTDIKSILHQESVESLVNYLDIFIKIACIQSPSTTYQSWQTILVSI